MIKQSRILVIDDDDFIINLISAALTKEEKYDFSCVSNGQEALDLLKSQNFDLIITDIIMPRLDGLQFIDGLRKTDKKTPVIAISGGDEAGNIDQYIEFASHFAHKTLKKPFSKAELIETIEDILNNPPGDVIKFV